MTTVAALYVDPRGPYMRMPDVECWTEREDARSYAGPWRVVAHPPCGPWSRLRHLYKGSEHDCAPLALEAVRRFGGVLEHPAHSLFWNHARLPEPGEFPDAHGGWSLAVDQCAWGHVARKPTWLYFVGVNRGDVVPLTGGTPTHWCSGFRTSTGRTPASYKRTGCAVPPGIKVCSAQQRRRTPPAFAEWLVSIARSADQGITRSAVPGER